MIVMRSSFFIGALMLAAPPFLLPAAVLLPVLATPAAAQQVASNVTPPVVALYGGLTAIQSQGSSRTFDQRIQALAPLVDRALNLPIILQNSVGLRYASLPEPQKQQLGQLFRQFTIARYVSNFTGSDGDTLKVFPNPHASAYGSDQIVQTQIVSSSGNITKVDYVMRQFPQGWQAVDVLLEGHISQVAVQRSDFGSTVSTGDATSLIESLKKKIQSFSEG